MGPIIETITKNFNNVGLRLKRIARIISWLVLIPGIILFFILLNAGTIGIAFVILLIYLLLSSFLSIIPEALGEIVLCLQQISENTNPNKKTVVKKTIKYKCNKCGSIIDTLPCPICNKPTQENFASVIDDVFCENCGADISNDYDVCHVCGKNI